VTPPGENIAVLATYTAMLDFRTTVLGSRRSSVADVAAVADAAATTGATATDAAGGP
jgi:hypothetical protein